MSHIALYRKYRSQSFDELIGQAHITKTLQASFDSSRYAHAYLFTGPRGTGKTSTARIVAKSLICEKGPTGSPCNVCAACMSITAGAHPDVLEMDAASEAGVDDVRQNIIERAHYAPMQARAKVYIIDEVHDLSPKAFDALLKTIEEPPGHVVFVLATTELSKVPVTIRSRCQRYEFRRGSLRDIVERLEFVCRTEGYEAEPAALTTIARMADGGFRDALTLLEQAAITSGPSITLKGVTQQLGLLDEHQVDRILEAAASCDVQELLLAADEAVRDGKEPREVLESLLYRLAALTYVLFDADVIRGLDPEKKAADHALAVRIGRGKLLHFRSTLANAHKEIRSVGLPRLWLEVALLELVAPPATPEPQQPETTPPIRAVISEPEKTRPSSKVEGSPSDLWARTVAGLSERFPKSAPYLQGTEVNSVSAKTVRIKVSSRFQYDRLMGRDEVRRTISEWYRREMGDDAWNVEFFCDERDQPEPDAPAVQSPLQGEHLANAVEQVFGVKPE